MQGIQLECIKAILIKMGTQKRMPWVDYMKMTGMYFIVLGHFFSIGAAYVYVFNVPLFFIISGFLCKWEESHLLFWRKLWWNLVVPMLIICGINLLISCIISVRDGTFDMMEAMKFFPRLIVGMHRGLGTCWFIYTLIVIKIIYQYTKNGALLLLLSVAGLSVAYALNEADLLQTSNAVVNVCTALPFFLIGAYLGRMKETLDDVTSWKTLLLLSGIGVCFLCISGHYNGGNIWMYICKYGKDIYWFIIGGVAGTLAIYAFSKMINKPHRYVETISTGCIVILGFHGYFINLVRLFYPTPSFVDFIFSAVIIVAFIPIILVVERFFPLLLGKYRIKAG